LTNHRKKRARVIQKQSLKRAAEPQCFSQVFRLHPHCAAWELHNRFVGRNDTAQENIDAHKTFATDYADLDGAAIVCGIDHRDHGFFGKVYVLDFLIRPVNDLTGFQLHVLKLGQKVLVLCGKQGGEDTVSDRNMGG
jgi:hypothetical protein